MQLNFSVCKNAKPKEKPYKLADGGGLYIEVMPNGSKYWRLKYRFGGKEKRLALGIFPTIGLLEACEGREKAKKILAAGKDPSSEKKETRRKRQLNDANTFELIAREWHTLNKRKWTERHGNYILKRLENDIFPKLGNAPIREIDAPRLLEVIRGIEKRGANEIAHRVLQTCGQIFRYAIVTGRGERDVSADLRGALEHVEHGHYAALDAKALPEFLKTLEQNNARLYSAETKAIRKRLME